MAEPDYYALLGVDRGASNHEIRQRFREQVLAQHPDKGGDPRAFQLLNKAYNILTDPEKRELYDATGRSERSAEEEFAMGFGGGRMHGQTRAKDADAKAMVNMQDRLNKGPTEHEDGFAEWLRQRDPSEMVMSDKDFMKTALFNAAELATKVNHPGPVQHVLGSPKTDAYGQQVPGPVQVQAKPRPIRGAIDHDEILVRMLAVPLDDAMVYAELAKGGVCLGMTGVGRIEQAGQNITEYRPEDCVLVLPKPGKFSSQRPIGTARTLMVCHEEDVLRVSPTILEELTPEQICLAPTIVCAYILLENYGAKLKPGDSILLNAAHMSAGGSALLQLCKLLKLKPLCILDLPGAPKNLVRGEYGSKSAWQEADGRAAAPPAVRQHYERISEWLVGAGAEEVFPDAAALLKWRDRNQRMLPKLALDGISTRESAEQLIHCLQPGDKDSQCVVYGHGAAQPIEIHPPLLSAWGGTLLGFSLNNWVHSLSANAKKFMSVMENITKLIRANKFSLDTVLYKVGEDAVTDAFSRAADASDSSQVVLIFPALDEELRNNGGAEGAWDARQPAGQARGAQQAPARSPEEEERERLKADWLNLLFTENSVAAMSPEGPLPTTMEAGNTAAPKSLIVWLGDEPAGENMLLKGLAASLGSSALLCLSWDQHPAGEGLTDFPLTSPEVLNGSWYLRDRATFENEDLDHLHDVELLSRCMIESVNASLKRYGLTWRNVVFTGFGKGAGLLFYASVIRLLPQQVAGAVYFNAIVPFPSFLAEKAAKRADRTPVKVFTVWGSQDATTPMNYRQALQQALRKYPEVQCTSDVLPDGDHIFNEKSVGVLSSLLPLVAPR